MRNAGRRLRILGFLAALCVFAAGAQEAEFSGVDRVVAVADIHGAYSAFVDVLGESELVDADLGWAGGTSHLVIVGDVFDRGPDSRRALDLIMHLESEAAAVGGRVHMLLGNHEVMNLTGDLRYVSDAEYAAFAGDESPTMRERAFARYRSARRSDADEAAARASFEEQFPPGFFAHRASFAPDGEYGRWLLARPFTVVINGTAFVHGGLSEAVAGRNAAELNAELGAALKRYVDALAVLIETGILEPTDNFYDHPMLLDAHDERTQSGEAEWPDGTREAADELLSAFDSLVFLGDGPTWYRGNVSCSPLIEAHRLAGALDGFGAERLVVGHTPTTDASVQTRFEDRLIRIDTGMLAEYYGGRAAALVLDDDSPSVVYAEKGVAVPVTQPRMLGSRPGNLSDDELEGFLRDAEVVDRLEREDLTELRLRRDDIELTALFRPAERRGLQPEVAAYALDRLLDLGMVPVTARREIDGTEGSVQFMPEGAFTEAERRERQLGGAWCPLTDQFEAMYVFDSLIFNAYRTANRILFNENDLRVLLIGHEQAFTTGRGRPDYLESVDLAIGPAWRDRLESLDEDLLNEHLGTWLDGRRIRALLDRRDRLLEED